MSSARWLADCFRSGIPPAPVTSVCDWARENVQLVGSARSAAYDPDITPWTRDVIETAGDGVTQICTFVKPVQSGGSVAGEIALCYLIATSPGGDAQYNWTNSEKALERWDKRIEKILLASPAVRARWPADRHKAKRGMVIMPHMNLTVQGVFSADNLDSDSIRIQINEEIHAWEAGRLAKAYNRSTAFWNAYALNISNAGTRGDQLHKAFLSGTQEHWETRCSGCGVFHAMFVRSEDGAPGGLRYDADGCRRDDGTYDYNRLASTVRYEFPCCGYVVRDTPSERRALSMSSRYSPPRNAGALRAHRSFTFEAVSVDYIPFLKLIQEKHDALRAMKGGDPIPWMRYLQERESKFWDESEHRGSSRPIVISPEVVKSRDGMADRMMRVATVDKQRGVAEDGELPHYWALIVDWGRDGSSLVVWEGKILTDSDLLAILEEHKVYPWLTYVDSGDDTIEVYKLCARHGFNALKGDRVSTFFNPQKKRRLPYTDEKALWEMMPTARPAYPRVRLAGGQFGNHPQEPLFIRYSKHGVREILFHLQNSDRPPTIPKDVGEDFRKHMQAEERVMKANPDGAMLPHWKCPPKRRNDLFVCLCYQAMVAHMAGLIGAVDITPSAEESHE
jgi:hypothetical protein